MHNTIQGNANTSKYTYKEVTHIKYAYINTYKYKNMHTDTRIQKWLQKERCLSLSNTLKCFSKIFFNNEMIQVHSLS